MTSTTADSVTDTSAHVQRHDTTAIGHKAPVTSPDTALGPPQAEFAHTAASAISVFSDCDRMTGYGPCSNPVNWFLFFFLKHRAPPEFHPLPLPALLLS